MMDTQSCQIPDRFHDQALAGELSIRLAGSRADGSSAPVPQDGSPVIWVDRGDEVLVHLDSVQVKTLDGRLLISIDLETDQTGRTPLIVAFALGKGPDDPAGLVATTDEYPRGDGRLAGRWGRPLQAAVWASLLGLAQDHAAERSGVPSSIAAQAGSLHFQSGDPLRITPAPATPPGEEECER